MAGFPLMAIGAGLGLFAEQQQKQRQAEANQQLARLAMQERQQHYAQQMAEAEKKNRLAMLLGGGDLGGGLGLGADALGGGGGGGFEGGVPGSVYPSPTGGIMGNSPNLTMGGAAYRQPGGGRYASAGGGFKSGLSYDDILGRMQGMGFQNPEVGAATFMAESRGNPFAEARTPKEDSVGIPQINLYAHPQYNREGLLGNVDAQLKAAFDVSKGGSDYSPWTMFKNGGYRSYLQPRANAPIPAASQAGQAIGPSYEGMPPGLRSEMGAAGMGDDEQPVAPGAQPAVSAGQPPGRQYAQAGPLTMTDARPNIPPPPQPPDENALKAQAIQEANAFGIPQAAGLRYQKLLAQAKAGYDFKLRQWETNFKIASEGRSEDRFAQTQTLAGKGSPEALMVRQPDGSFKRGMVTYDKRNNSYVDQRGQKVEVEPLPEKSGAGGLPHNIEVRDAQGKTVYSGAARMAPEGFIKPDGSPIQIPEGGSASMAGTGGGRQAATQIQAIIGSGNELLGELNNLMELPKTATLGIFQGLQNQPANELGAAMRRSFANKITPEEQTDLNTSFQGVARSLATIEAQGRATGLVGLTEQAKSLAPMSGDTLGNVLRKYATLRQILERGLETVQANRDISPDQKVLMQKMLDEVKTVVPFTVSEVNKLQHGDVESYREVASKLGFGAAAGGPPPEAIAHLKGDKDPKARENFDAVFGQGAAAKALGQ